MKREELENYEPKGDLIGFPKEVIARMLDYQEEQVNPRDISVFERDRTAGQYVEGFAWHKTKEGKNFWYEVIINKDFNLFFEKYPKQDYQDNSQEFRVGDEVINIFKRQRGKILRTDGDSTFPVYVGFGEKEDYTLDGRYYFNDKYPRLLHYRDDYDYDVIDFNNLPKRQEAKRWRAKKRGEYYTIRFDYEYWFFTCAPKDNNSSIDDINYNSGNYFRTEAEAEIIAQKLNTYFKQLITKLI